MLPRAQSTLQLKLCRWQGSQPVLRLAFVFAFGANRSLTTSFGRSAGQTLRMVCCASWATAATDRSTRECTSMHRCAVKTYMGGNRMPTGCCTSHPPRLHQGPPSGLVSECPVGCLSPVTAMFTAVPNSHFDARCSIEGLPLYAISTLVVNAMSIPPLNHIAPTPPALLQTGRYQGAKH